MQATCPLATVIDPFVSKASLDRMQLCRGPAQRAATTTADGATAMAEALDILRGAGLSAVASRLEPGGIMGGLALLERENGRMLFPDGFVIFCEESGYLASVTGPGNASHEAPCATLRKAAHAVVTEYTRRGDLPKSSPA